MLSKNAGDCARAVCNHMLTDAGWPTPDTLNAVACIVEACWNTTGMDTEQTPECMAHVGMFALPIVRLVRINAGLPDVIPAHNLCDVGDIVFACHVANVEGRRAAMLARMFELRKKRTTPQT